MVRISVVVPTLNEAAQLGQTLATARAALGGTAEYLVIDGGSSDDTVGIAARHGARVIHTERGRGRQLAVGAQSASGDCILFLHADTLLPPDAGQAITDALRDSDVVGGAFALRIGKSSRGSLLLRLLARSITLRSRIFRTATGDQAIFVRAAHLAQIGGVPAVPLFEDVRLIRKLRATGHIAILAAAVTTSPRLWERFGPLRLILLHLGFRALHALGVSPWRLARWYPGLGPAFKG